MGSKNEVKDDALDDDDVDATVFFGVVKGGGF